MENKGKWRAALLPWALGVASFAHAQEDAPALTLPELEQRILILERQLELQAEEAERKAPEQTSATAGDKGFALKSARGDYEWRFGALLQADARAYLDDPLPATGPVDSFLLRRVEPTFSGSIGTLVGFRFTPQFAGSSFDTADLYGELRFHSAAVLRGGKFKQPVGLENLQSSGALSFAERGLTVNLVPNRDVGLQVGGEFADSRVNYALGLFNGAADRSDGPASDSNDGKELAARIFTEPFRNDPGVLQGLGVGIATTYTDHDVAAGPSAPAASASYRSPGQLSIFAYEGAVAASGSTAALPATAASGEQIRWVPQASFYHDRFGLLAEYVRSAGEFSRGATRRKLEHAAWQLSGSWVLSGESASYRGVRPQQPFRTGGPGWGAFEVALRHGVLNLDKDAFRGAGSVATGGTAGTTELRLANPATQVESARATGLALNWYLTAQARLAVNYEFTRFDGGAGSVSAPRDRNDEQVLISRLQLSF